MDDVDTAGQLVIAEHGKSSSPDPNCREEGGQSIPLQTGQTVISSPTSQSPLQQPGAVWAQSMVQNKEMPCADPKKVIFSFKHHPHTGDCQPVTEINVWKEYPREIRLPLIKRNLQADDRKQLTITYSRAANGQVMLCCENCDFERAPVDFHEHVIMHLITQPFRCAEKGCTSLGFADDGGLVGHYVNCHPNVQPRKTFPKSVVTMVNKKISYLIKQSKEAGHLRWTYNLSNAQVYSPDTRTSRAWRMSSFTYLEMEQPAECVMNETSQGVPPSCRLSADPETDGLLTFSGLPAAEPKSSQGKGKFHLLENGDPVTRHKSKISRADQLQRLARMRLNSRKPSVETPSASPSESNSQDQAERPEAAEDLLTLEGCYHQTVNAAGEGGSATCQGTVGVENGESTTGTDFDNGPATDSLPESVERVRSGHGHDDGDVALLMEVYEEDMTCSPHQQKSLETKSALGVEATLNDVSCRVGFFRENSGDWVQITPREPESPYKKPALMVRGLPAPDVAVEPVKNTSPTAAVMASTAPVSPVLAYPITPASNPSSRSVSSPVQGEVLPSPPGHAHTAAVARTSNAAASPMMEESSTVSRGSSTVTAYRSSSEDEAACEEEVEDEAACEEAEGQAPLTVLKSPSPEPQTAALKSSTIPPPSCASSGTGATIPSSSSPSQDAPGGGDGGSGKRDAGGGDGHHESDGNATKSVAAGVQIVHLLCNLNYPPTFTLNMISLEEAFEMYQQALQRKRGSRGYMISILISLNWVRCVDCCCKLNGMDHMVRHLWRHSHVGGIPCGFCENAPRPAGQCVHIVKMVADVRSMLREKKRAGVLSLASVDSEEFPAKPSPSVLKSVDGDLAICQDPVEMVTIDDENDDEDCLVVEKPVVVKQEPVSDEDSTPSQSRHAAEEQPSRPEDQSLVSRQRQGEVFPPPQSQSSTSGIQPSVLPSTQSDPRTAAVAGVQPSVALPPPQSRLHPAAMAGPSTSGIQPSVALPPPQNRPHTAAVAQPSTCQPTMALPPPPNHPHTAAVAQPSTSGIQPIVIEEIPDKPGHSAAGSDPSTAIDLDSDARAESQPTEDTVHLPSSLQPYYYHCNHCSLSFLKRWCLEVHLKTMHPIPEVPHYTCALCLVLCKSVETLLLHMDSHMESTVDRVIPCLYQTCGEIFTSAPEYFQHQGRVHPERCTFLCVCGKVFNSVEKMLQHLFIKAIPVFKCSVCSAKACDHDLLVKHVSDAHGGDGCIAAKVIFTCFLQKKRYDLGLIASSQERLSSDLSRKTPLMCNTCHLVHPDTEAQKWHEACHAGTNVTSDVFVHNEGKTLPEENDLSCPHCPEKFRIGPTFVQHVRCHMACTVVNVYRCTVHKKFFTTQRDVFLQHIRSPRLSQSHSAFSEQQLYSSKVTKCNSQVAGCSEPGCSYLCFDKITLAFHKIKAHQPTQDAVAAPGSMPGTSPAGLLVGHQGGFGQQSGTVTTSALGRPANPLHQTSTAVSQQPLHQTSPAVSGLRTQQPMPFATARGFIDPQLTATATGSINPQHAIHQTSSAVSHPLSHQTSPAVSGFRTQPFATAIGPNNLQNAIHQTSNAMSHQLPHQTSSAVANHPFHQTSSAISRQLLHQTISTASQQPLHQAGAGESQIQVRQQWVSPLGPTPRSVNTGGSFIGASGAGAAMPTTVSCSLPHQGLTQGATTVGFAPPPAASMSADTATPQFPTSSVAPLQQWFVVGSLLSQVQDRGKGLLPGNMPVSVQQCLPVSTGAANAAAMNAAQGPFGGGISVQGTSSTGNYSHQQGAQNGGVQRPQTIGVPAQQNMGIPRPQITGGQGPQNVGVPRPQNAYMQAPQMNSAMPPPPCAGYNENMQQCSAPQHQPMHPSNLGMSASVPPAVPGEQSLLRQRLQQTLQKTMQQQASMSHPRMGFGVPQLPQAQNTQALDNPQQPPSVRLPVNGMSAQLPYRGPSIRVEPPQTLAGTPMLQQMNTSVETKQGPFSAPVPAGHPSTMVQGQTVSGLGLASHSAAATSPNVIVSSAPQIHPTTVVFPSSTSTPVTHSVPVGNNVANPGGSSFHHGSGRPSAVSLAAPAPPHSLEPTQRSGTISSGNALISNPIRTGCLTSEEVTNSRRKQHLEMRKVEDASLEVVESMQKDAEPEMSIKVLNACSIPEQIFNGLGDPNLEAGSNGDWCGGQVRPLEGVAGVGGTSGAAEHLWPHLAEKNGCGPCAVNLCDVRGMVPASGTVTVSKYLLRMLRKRKCCSNSARSDDSSGVENDDETPSFMRYGQHKKRKIIPDLESDDENMDTWVDTAGEADSEGEDMDFDTLEKAAIQVREETILLDRDQASETGMDIPGTNTNTKKGEKQPGKPKTVDQPPSTSGSSGDKRRGRLPKVSQTLSQANEGVTCLEARDRKEGPQEVSDSTNSDLPKAVCLVCKVTFLGLDVASDVMTHLRHCHGIELTYNRCPYCMAVSDKVADVEKHVEVYHPDHCMAVVTHEFPESLGSRTVPLSPTCLNQEVPAQACAPGPSEGKGLAKDRYKDTVDKCLICQERLEDSALRNHMKDAHLLTSMYKCGHCLAVSDSPQNVAWHSKICHQNIWVINHGMLNHVEQEQQPPMAKEISLAKPSVQGELNTCLLCKEKFEDEDTKKMAEHMVRNHANAMVKCGHCHCVSTSTADIVNHCRKCHGTVKLAVYPILDSRSVRGAGRRAGTHGASSSQQQQQEGKTPGERATPPEQDGKASCWSFICTKCGMCCTDRTVFSDHTQACFQLEPFSYVCPRAACSTVRRSFAHLEDYYHHARDQHGSATEPSLVKNRLEVRRLDFLISSGENLAEQLQVPNPEGLVQSVSRLYLGLAGPSGQDESEVPKSLPAETETEKASTSTASVDKRTLRTPEVDRSRKAKKGQRGRKKTKSRR